MKTNSVLDLAQKLKRARVLTGLSQKELGKKLGVSDKTISAYELGRAIPPLPTLQKIAEITEKPLEYFFEEKTEMDKLKTIEKKLDIIVEEIRKLSNNLKNDGQ